MLYFEILWKRILSNSESFHREWHTYMIFQKCNSIQQKHILAENTDVTRASETTGKSTVLTARSIWLKGNPKGPQQGPFGFEISRWPLDSIAWRLYDVHSRYGTLKAGVFPLISFLIWLIEMLALFIHWRICIMIVWWNKWFIWSTTYKHIALWKIMTSKFETESLP